MTDRGASGGSSEAPRGGGDPLRAAAPGGGKRRLFAALAAAAVIIVGLLLLVLRDRTPRLAPGDLEKARDRWLRLGPADYDIAIVVDTDAHPLERYTTEVRAGQARRLLRDGQAVDPRDSYTVPGLFDAIARELEMASEARPAGGAPRGAALRARFDEATGAPLVFKRLAGRKQSVVIAVERIVTPEGKTLLGK